MKNLYTLAAVLFAFTANAQIINIPDPVFKNILVNTECCGMVSDHDVDTNNDGEIDLTEASAETFISIFSTGVTSLEGIQYFSNLQVLHCSNNQLTTLDLSNNLALSDVRCDHNQLTSLILPENGVLSGITCNDNFLTTLDLGNAALGRLDCSNNSLTTVDLSDISFYDSEFNYVYMNLANNDLTTLEFPPLTGKFEVLNISGNPLTGNFVIPVRGIEFYCNSTSLTSIDFSNAWFSEWSLQSNPNLQYINFKNGTVDIDDPEEIVVSNNSSLQFVCVDEGYEGAQLQYIFNDLNILFSTYCSFEPGGQYNTVAGNVTLECGGSNINLSNVQLQVDGPLNEGSTFTGNSGNYLVYTNTGLVTISPQLQNVAYFTVSPPNFSYDFLTNGNTQNANFCVTPNGVHPDLDITLLPIVAARPGFDAIYKIVYKNKGNQNQSGNILLTFNDAILDFIEANPTASTVAVNNLSWDFTNLAPFESHEITFTLNVNSPVETPAVNNGDVLAFTVSANAGSDESPADNSSELNQIVVGSFDPNDKAVTEGSQIDITNVENYLHYLVRFQNTGTFAAENVVVKDVLSSLLDASTLQMVSASHNYRSTLTNGNQLEFFFENINLQDSTTDEQGSNGHIAFKIKPANTVGLGSIIENTAEIYFDFNFPVVTNTVATTVTTLANKQFDRSGHFTLFPNPVQDFITIKSDLQITAIEIHNSLGQVVMASTVQNKIDVSNLSSGMYLITVTSNGTQSVQKFIKL